ncbi:polysaccharide deacetylase family protein [Bacillus sp. B190/17]|uniref:Polysaccharide deacetylase family protein n=1 Tax=Bacillus lumedeiriae TaxID=3058829 RepID=A0ABW8IDA1_9BACI
MIRSIFFVCTLLISYFSTSVWTQAHTSSRDKFEKSGHVVWEVNAQTKLVAITFDDGPDPRYTPQILDILAKHNAKATFFVTGKNADKFPHILKRTVKENHAVGNHTYNHIYDKSTNSKKLKTELDLTAQTIKNITGKETSLFRPVGDVYNDSVIRNAVQKNYLVVMWSWHQDPKDWLRPSANKISSHVTKNVKSGDIILLHDAGGNRTQTVEALDTILTYLDKNGYKCVTIPELIYHAQVIEKDKLHIFPIHSM